MSAHTPGPWVLEREPADHFDGGHRISADGAYIMGDPRYYPFTPSNDADWLLIAAAPDLLQALHSLLAVCREELDPKRTPQMALAQAAIAKAKGYE